MLHCLCIICLNTYQITGKQQLICGNIADISQVILFFFSSESFKYKKSITGNTYNFLDCDGEYDAEKVRKNETEIFAPLKHLNNSWRTLEIPLINCEIEMILTWSKNSVLPDMAVRAAGNNDKPTAIVAPNGLEFQLKDTKLYVPFVSLSKKDDKILLKQLKS